MKPDICIHHAPCADGFTAAWAVWKRWPDIEFVPGVYGEAPPDVTGKKVLIVDFSYKRLVLEAMGGVAEWVVVVDHHKSAQADLAPYAGVPTFSSLIEEAQRRKLAGKPAIAAWFDMDQSGAMLAWKYVHGFEPPPMLVKFVQDRDLWRFDMPGCREAAAELFSRPYSFKDWAWIAAELETEDGLKRIVSAGAAIERKHHKDVGELLKICTREMVIGGVRVKVANIPYTLSSDAANHLAEGAAFGACYYDAADGARVFSLRSKPGGGHAQAAGFRAAAGWEGDAA